MRTRGLSMSKKKSNYELEMKLYCFSELFELARPIYRLDCGNIVIYEDGEEGIELTRCFSSILLNHLIGLDKIYLKAYQICSYITLESFTK